MDENDETVAFRYYAQAPQNAWNENLHQSLPSQPAVKINVIKK